MKIICLTDINVEIPFDSLIGVTLDGLNLHRALLEDTDLSNSTLSNIDFRVAFLAQSNFTNCKFYKVSFITAYLMGAKLINVAMKECWARATNFESADLSFANLNGLDVSGANFSNCNLKGTIMKCINIDLAEFTGAVYDGDTVWPDSFNPDNMGCIKSGV